MTLVLAAPHTEDPREEGFAHTYPGELLYRPFTCTDSAQLCGCSNAWAGMATHKHTTLAHVVEHPHLDPDTYVQLLAAYLIGERGWERDDAQAEAQELADIASHFGAGALLAAGLDHITVIDTDHTS